MKNKKEVKLTLTNIEQFLNILDPDAQHFHFQVFDDSGKSNVSPSTIVGTLKDKANILASKNADGAGVFVAIQPHPKDKPRKKEFTSEVRTFLIDLDGAPLDPVLETLKEVGLSPNMVVNTSMGKYHVYIKVSGCPLDQYRRVQKELAAMFGGDPAVSDLPRVARVPDFNHNKDPKNPFMVCLHSVGDSEPYQFKTIIDRLGIQLVGNRKTSSEKKPSAVLSGDEILEGSRNKDLFAIGRKLRGLGVPESEIKKAMDTANLERCCPMLDQDELDKTFESVLSYKPDPEPFGTISKEGEGEIAGVFRSSGLADLTIDSSPDVINKTLYTAVKLSAGMQGSSQLLLQDEVKKKLKAIGIKSPAPLVKQAFPPVKQEEHDDAEVIGFLQETEPYEGDVQGAELLNEIETNISRYVLIDKDSLSAISLWVMHAWCLDAFSLSPFLRIISPTKGCGKTTLLTLISEMLPKCLLSANITSASMFRLIDKFKASVGIDEADGAFKENYELISLVNSSYTRSTAQVPRCASETNEVELFSVWGAKVICGIGKLPPTTEDRSIVIHLKKKRNGEKVEKFRYDKLGAFGDLKSKLKRFSDDHIEALKEADDPKLPEQLGDRPADNWRQLILIANLVGEGWPDKARAAALTLNDSQEDEENLVHLLRDIRRIFNQEGEGVGELSSADLTAQLVGVEGSPWANSSGKYADVLTANKLAKMLAPLGIKSQKIRFDDKTLQGYKFPLFDDAFDRYLPKDDGSNDDIDWDYAFGDPYAFYDGEPIEVHFSAISAN
jgi:putative DNA primase/helicase